MKYVIVGGGNIGTVLAAELKRITSQEVVVVTSRPTEWNGKITVFDESGQNLYSVDNIHFGKEFVSDGDVYFYTLPKQILSRKIKEQSEAVNDMAISVFLPGTGGMEYLLPVDSKKAVIGLQRVPYIARIKKYGESVFLLSKKDEIFYAERGNTYGFDISQVLEIKSTKLHNFLEVTLTPSNPILHTSRLFAIFSGRPIDYLYSRNILFYEEWDDFSSEILIKCDAELQKAIAVLKEINLSMVKSLTEHYESYDIPSMTKKISGIKAFKGIESPMKRIDENAYKADLESRYFKEDFSYGLFIIKAIAEICGTSTPTIDMILRWYEEISGEKLLTANNKIISNKKYNLPQNIGIDTVEKLVGFYKQ